MNKRTNELLDTLLPALMFLVFLAGMTYIQFSTPNLPDNDGFYHIRMAWLMRTQGLKPDFIWMPLTILNPREFYDHHFLYHVALIPFTYFSDLLNGAKWSAVFFASLAFLAIWQLLERQKVPYAALWGVAVLGVSQAFLYRMSVTRAQSVSLGILALAMIFLLERRHLALGVLAFFYVWTYDAFPLILALAGLYTLAAALTERRLVWRPLVYAGAGVALGMLVNPYFPDNIIFTYRHLLPKLTDATAVSVGNEWYPYDTGQILGNSLGSLAAFVLGALGLGLSGRKMDLRTAFSFLAVTLFGLMFFQARRFVEYFPAFALIFAAFAWAPILQEEWAARHLRDLSLPLGRRLWFWVPVLVVLAFGVYSVNDSLNEARSSLMDSKAYDTYAKASAWLDANTPEGARIFQTDWDDFPRLFFYNVHNTYLVGLDPTYLQLADPALYDQWVEITQGSIVLPAHDIYYLFGAEYVHSDRKHGGFIRTASQDSAMQEVYRDDDSIIYHILVDKLP